MMNTKSGINFDNSYLSLNNKMYTKIEVRQEYDPELQVINEELADELGISIEYLKSKEGLKLLTGTAKDVPAFAQAYAGHQFGHFTMLGDGRAMILGEHITKSNNRYDIQLKGSGRTPYSRGGDGKATLSSMLREYIYSEAIHYLNITTTRSLAVVKTNEAVMRQGIQPGAILTRIAKSHIRVGTFEYAKAYGGKELVKELTDYTINRHYIDLNNHPNKYIAFLKEVINRQALLIAKWQSVGFIHGVMNTDNVLISGETIDYGPCAFMDTYDPSTVFSSIDQQGRYAYINQPTIGSWNMARLAEAILPLLDDNIETAVELANKALVTFEVLFNKYWLEHMSLKIGIKEPLESDKELIQELLDMMYQNQEDFINTFRLLTTSDYSSLKMFGKKEFTIWLKKWNNTLLEKQITKEEAISLMKSHNPVLIPRNSLIEEALLNASKDNDYELYDELLIFLKRPFDYDEEYRDEFLNPKVSSTKHVTYCGT